jgi:arylsulfatase
VLVILTDDQGFASSEVFGGVIPTPAFARLAQEGLSYNSFHTTGMCSPTRAALLTGRNHHNVGMGRLTDQPARYEGYTSIIPDTAATIADLLKHNGYSTAMFGKAHVTPSWELTEVGPFERWPTGLGFEYFYGFLQGDTNQWTPTLVENTRYVQPPSNDPS